MIQRVTGYITEQGRFFPDQDSAALDEATEALYDSCREKGMNPDTLLEAVNSVFSELHSYMQLKEQVHGAPKAESITDKQELPDATSEEEESSGTAPRKTDKLRK